MLEEWDEEFLNKGSTQKWVYVSKYINNHWVKYISDRYFITSEENPHEFVKKNYIKLADSSYPNKKVVLKKTREAWRAYNKRKTCKESENWINVKITNEEKKRLEILAKAIGSCSKNEVISSLINENYKIVLNQKNIEKKERARLKEIRETREKMELPRTASFNVNNIFAANKIKLLQEQGVNYCEEIDILKKNLYYALQQCCNQQVFLNRNDTKEEVLSKLTARELKEAQKLTNKIYSKAINREILSDT